MQSLPQQYLLRQRVLATVTELSKLFTACLSITIIELAVTHAIKNYVFKTYITRQATIMTLASLVTDTLNA